MTTRTKLVTYDDYRNLPNDGKRYEIIGGELLMTPAPTTVHQRILGKLYNLISNRVDKDGLGEVFMAPVDVVLSMTDVVQPDLVFVSKERSHIITKKNIVEAPDLVIEILSESTEAIDRNQKKRLYESYGVNEYWLVDPGKDQVEMYSLSDNNFQKKGAFGLTDTLASRVVEGLSFEPGKVFKR